MTRDDQLRRQYRAALETLRAAGMVDVYETDLGFKRFKDELRYIAAEERYNRRRSRVDAKRKP